MSDVARPSDADTAAALAAQVLRRVPAVTDELVRVINARNPGYRELNSVPAEDLWQSCHDNITRVVEMIAGQDRPDRFDAANATGRRRAEQRMPLDDVLRSFRLGGRLVWEALIDEARAQGMVDTDALLAVASKVWEVVDSTSSQVAEAYHGAERALLRVDEQRLATLWEGLLHGRAREPAFAAEVARTLGMPVDGRFAVLVAERPGAAPERADAELPSAALDRRLRAAGAQCGWQVRPHTVVGLLALGAAGLDPVLAVLRDAVTGPAGLSGVVFGLSDVESGYRQAVLARETLPAGRVEVAALAERLPEALLISSPELAEQLVRRWLGPLLALPAADRELLLDTLRIWVAAGGSVRRTAELAHCHRNTVLNRLHRIHQLAGHDLTTGGYGVELGLALRAVRLFPRLCI